MTTTLPAFLLAYSLQLAIVVAGLFLVVRVLTPRSAVLRLRVWQSALALTVVIPVTAFVPIVPAPSGNGRALLSMASVSIGPLRSVDAGSWPSWLLLVVLVGIALRAAEIAAGWLALRRRFGRSRPDDDRRFVATCETVGARAHLIWRHDVSQPFTFGIARPLVVVPEDLRSAPDGTLRAVFVHELMHVRRRDWRWVIAEEAIRAALWYHPAIWLLLGELRQAREEVIDRATVRLLGSRRSYLETLIALADRGERLRLSPALPFFRSCQLARRIAALASDASMSRLRVVFTCAALLITSLATLGAATRTFPIPPLLPDPTGYAVADDPSRDAQPRGITRPVPIDMKKAAYPKSAQAKKIQGDVVLDVKIDTQGKVSDVRVVKALAPELDAAAADAIRASTFRPGTKDGIAVPVKVTITVAFRLK